MKTSPQTSQPAGAGGQLFAKCALPVGSQGAALASEWLAETLAPLDLPPALLDKLLQSAHQAAERASQANATAQVNATHFHLLVYAPDGRAAEGQTWGFFRMEKIGSAAGSNGSGVPDHTIEFYLYLEG